MTPWDSASWDVVKYMVSANIWQTFEKLAKYISGASEENNVPCFGILGNLILNFSKLLNQKAIHKPSAQHVLDDDYYKRIEAIPVSYTHLTLPTKA